MTLPENLAIRVRDICKSYEIEHIEQAKSEQKQNVKRRFHWPKQWQEDTKQSISRETFWALCDISFDVPTGQVLGVIGRNGAGKSTFLKILSQIIEPTLGHAEIRGRVGSLLEVGTGFHPELTGRENIYLNGTLLGMRRKQINSVFDEIVAFAEVDRFIDTPVKRYSSGMYVRLAFAVAAYLQPDVLIIDEVLSVGDAVFQEKCLGRMQSLGEAGRTVIFVSHNMEAVAALCDRAIVLHEGKLFFDGSPQEATDAYYELCKQQNPSSHLEYRERGGSSPDIIKTVKAEYKFCSNKNNVIENELIIAVTGKISSDNQLPNGPLTLGIGINQENGVRLATYVASRDDEALKLVNGSFSYVFRIDDPPLHPGTYLIDVSLLCRDVTVDSVQRCSDFRIPHPAADHYTGRDTAWGSLRLACSSYNCTTFRSEDS